MSVFTYRITTENDQPVAYIDRDGSLCIRQEIDHYSGVTFSTEEEAEAWAIKHVAEINEQQEAADAAAAAKAEESRKIDEIHAMLSALTKNS